MKKTFAAAVAMAVIATTTPAAFAELPTAVKARQGQFNIMQLNLGVLGGMARGTVEFDADAAQAAADSLVAVSMIHQGAMWPEGSAVEGSRAKEDIWSNMDDFNSKWMAFGEAAVAMQAAIGEGQAAIGPNMGALGGTCGACHDTYRLPK